MTDSIRIAEYPDMLKAIGDADQIMVFRSPVVRQSDSIMLPVLEHIERHSLVLADETTIEDAMMIGGKAVLSWYMTRDNMRDGRLGFDGPGALQRLWDRSDESPASPGTVAVLISSATDQFTASGDDRTHLLVRRGPLSMDTDETYLRAMEHVRERGYVLAYEGEAPPSNFNPDYPLRVRLYTTPDKRLLSGDYGILAGFGRMLDTVHQCFKPE